MAGWTCRVGQSGVQCLHYMKSLTIDGTPFASFPPADRIPTKACKRATKLTTALHRLAVVAKFDQSTPSHVRLLEIAAAFHGCFSSVLISAQILSAKLSANNEELVMRLPFFDSEYCGEATIADLSS